MFHGLWVVLRIGWGKLAARSYARRSVLVRKTNLCMCCFCVCAIATSHAPTATPADATSLPPISNASTPQSASFAGSEFNFPIMPRSWYSPPPSSSTPSILSLPLTLLLGVSPLPSLIQSFQPPSKYPRLAQLPNAT